MAHYRQLIALRKEMAIIVHGRYQSHLDDHGSAVAYTRSAGGQVLAVVANFSADTLSLAVPEALRGDGRRLLSNYRPVTQLGRTILLAPYELFALLMNDR